MKHCRTVRPYRPNSCKIPSPFTWVFTVIVIVGHGNNPYSNFSTGTQWLHAGDSEITEVLDNTSY